MLRLRQIPLSNGAMQTGGHTYLLQFAFFFLFSMISASALQAQCPGPDGDPCTAQRYDAGQRWDGAGSILIDSSGGVVACLGDLNMQPNLSPNAIYCDSTFQLPALTACTDYTTGDPIALTPPAVGQSILWYNFDVRADAGSYYFQLLCGADSVGWALFYSNSPTDTLNDNGLSGDCSDLTYDRCGTHFVGWADQAFATPVFDQATNFYLMVWDLEDEDFIVNFSARYGCGDGPSICVLDTTDILFDCNADGTSSVTVSIEGINGIYGAADPNALSITNNVTLTNLGANPAVTTGSFTLTYGSGAPYNITISESSDTTDCQVILNGTTPQCQGCEYTVTCPTFSEDSVACYEDLPTQSTYTIAEFAALGNGDGSIGDDPCGVIEISAANGIAPDCVTGGNVTRTYTITEYEDTDGDDVADTPLVVLNSNTCSQIIAVAANDLVLSSCPADEAFAACSNQADLNNRFAAWVASLNAMTVSGGCNPGTVQYSSDPNGLAMPDACNTTGTAYTVTVSATDDCGVQVECNSSFTVSALVEDLTLEGCPNPMVIGACTDQAAVDLAFTTWVDSLNAVTSNGGCGGESISYDVAPASLSAPDVCSTDATSYSVTVSATDSCGGEVECTSTFIVPAVSDDLTLEDCPADVSFPACADQTVVTAAFDAWVDSLNSVTTSGGCGGTITYDIDPASLSAPDACATDGTNYSVTATVTDACGVEIECTSTFQIAPFVPNLALVGCPAPVVITACTNQVAAELAFTAWVDSLVAVSSIGGCGGASITYDVEPASLIAPNVCASTETSYSVTATVIDDCDAQVECTSTFVVPAASDDLALQDCPADVSFPACADQTVVTAAFDAWVDSLNAVTSSGGCGGTITYDIDPASLDSPDACATDGTNYSVTATVTDDCGVEIECTSTFQVAPFVEDLSLVGCPGPVDFAACTNQAAADLAFNAWVDSLIAVSSTGGCGGATITYDVDPASLSAPNVCATTATSYSVTATVVDDCDAQVECTSSFTVVAYEDNVAINGCPADVSFTDCPAQSGVTAAFDDWVTALNGMTTTGGCNCGAIVFDLDPNTLSAPDICSATATTYTVTGSATDACGSTASCTSTFSVGAYADDLMIWGCPPAVVFGSCADQTEVTQAFNAWVGELNGLMATGGCNAGTISYSVDPSTLAMPDVCSADPTNYTVTTTLTDDCGSDVQCIATFSVGAGSGDLVLSGCPADESFASCSDPNSITEAFNEWVAALRGITVTGGCTGAEIAYSIDPDSLELPDGCGDTPTLYTVVVRVMDDCSGSSSQCTSNFEVGAYVDDLVLTGCPEDVEFESCAHQGVLATAFNDWVASLNNISATGGCNCCAVVFNIDPNSLVMPNVCSVTPIEYEITASVSDDCGGSVNCTSTFKMGGYEDNVMLSGCPDNVSFPACSNQGAVTSAFDQWVADLNAITVSGGCNCGEILFDVDPNTLAQPTVCSTDPTSYTVHVSVSDGCGGNDFCASTFYVGANSDDVALAGCPASIEFDACADQNKITNAFNGWIAGLKAIQGTGGCDCGGVTYDVHPDSLAVPSVCGSESLSYSVTSSVTDACGATAECTSTFKVATSGGGLKLSACPEDQYFGPCSDQSTMAIAFNTWIADLNAMTASGGCGEGKVEYSIDPNTLTICSVCSPTSHAYSVMISVNDGCGGKDWCTAKFEVAGYANDLAVECPSSESFAACTDQAEVTNAFNAWVQAIKDIATDGGCSPDDVTFSLDVDTLSMPDACSPNATSYSVTVSVADGCGGTAECTTSFDVAAQVDDLSLSACPPSIHMPACSDQVAVDSALTAWIDELQNMSASGSCTPGTPEFSVDLATIATCNACALTPTIYIVKVTVTDDCGGTAECTSKFEVPAVTPVAVTCPDPADFPNTISGCASQTEIDAAFANWLSGFAVKNPGCGINTSTDLYQYTPPQACPGAEQVVTVKYEAADGCTSDECEATFTLGGSADIVLNCSGLVKEVECSADVAPGTPVVAQDCGTVDLSVSGPVINGVPDCDGTTYTFVHKAKDACGREVTCEQVITIRNEPPTIDCSKADDLDMACGDDYASKIGAWIQATEAALEAAVTTSCACGFTISNNYDGSVPSSSCDISSGLEVVFTATDICGNTASCTKKITVSGSGAASSISVPGDTIVECGSAMPDPWYDTYGCVALDVSYHEKKVPYRTCEFDLIRTWKAVDNCGNEISKTQKIKVRDTQGPTIIPPRHITDNLVNGEMIFYGCETPQVPLSGVRVTDNCCVNIYKLKAFDVLLAKNACDRFGFHSKWRCGYVITDEAGNKSVFSFDMVQYDTSAPVIRNMPPDQDLGCNVYIPPANITAVKAYDNCGGTIYRKFDEVVKINPNDPRQKAILRTWSFKDKCGNRTSQTQVITVCGYDYDNSRSARIASTAWLDDGNGLQDEGEPGLNNIRVLLYGEGTARHDSVLVDSTTTSTQAGVYGRYVFDHLNEGTYTIRFIIPEGFNLTTCDVGDNANDDLDSDADQETGLIRRFEVRNGQVLGNLDAGFVEVSSSAPGDPNDMQQVDDEREEYTELDYSNPGTFTAPMDVGSLDVSATDWQEVQPFTAMMLSPNPASDRVMISFDATNDLTGELIMYDQLGQRVRSQSLQSARGFNQVEIDVQAYPAGVYLVQLVFDDQQQVLRLIKN